MKFKYQVWYKDSIYQDVCKASGRVSADTSLAAKAKLCEFYPNVSHIIITPLIMEESLEYDKEWDIDVG